MWVVVGWLVGMIFGFIIGFNIKSMLYNKKEEKKDTYLRRGIIDRGYTYTYDNTSYEVQIEVGELERTDKKSKVKSISMVANKSRFNSTENKESIKTLIDNTWIETSEIEWIKTSIEDDRDKKLKEILN